MDHVTQDTLEQALRGLIDPETGQDIVSSGLISNISITNGRVDIVLETSPENGAALENLRKTAEDFVKEISGVTKATVILTADTGKGIQATKDQQRTDDHYEQPHDKFNMDGHKLHWHLDRVAAWQAGERVVPLHIDMGISTGCNMACTYCYGVIQNRAGYGVDNEKGIFHMPTDKVKGVFKDAKDIGVRSIAIVGEGENTLHPDFYEILQYAKEIDLDISLATNGIRLHREPEKLETVLTCLTWLRINISAGTPETFMNIHKVPQFERVIENVRVAVKERNKHGYPCTIGLQMIVTKENEQDIVPLAKIGAELGVDYFVVKSCSDTPERTLDAPREEYWAMEQTFKEAESYSTEDYVVSVKWNKINNAGWKDYPVCFGTQFILALSGDGTLFPCGHWFDVRRDEFKMGNVIETPLREIISSERYWDVQNLVQTVDVNHDCETNCRQHYINQFLSPLRGKPDHVNFI